MFGRQRRFEALNALEANQARVQSPTRRPGLVTLGLGVVAGMALGVWHASLALRGLFVFGETEPFSAWVVLGTLLGTLPAAILALVSPRGAARSLWILGGALLVASALSMAPQEWGGFM